MTTKIDWPLDNFHTWNPVKGCSPVSPGCLNCYAARFAARNLHEQFRGLTEKVNGRPVFNGTVRLDWDALEEPRRWDKSKPRNVFVCSQSDLCHANVPKSFIAALLDEIFEAPTHRFFILTKRLERLVGLIIPDNCWVGVSVEDRQWANERLPVLDKIQAAHKFVSFEPLIAGVGLIPLKWMTYQWAIGGGESGPGARPMHEDWLWNLIGCHERAGIPLYFKQLGRELARKIAPNDRSPKGNQPEHWPKWAQHREGPPR